MNKLSRVSLGVGLLATGLVTGVVANADAASQFRAQGIQVASAKPGATPAFRSFSGFLGVASAAAAELLGSPAGTPLFVSLAFELADYYSDGVEPDIKAVGDATLLKNAEANFDSEIATAS